MSDSDIEGSCGCAGDLGRSEAGLIDVQPIAFVPRIDMLALAPNLQALLAQTAALVAILLGFWYNRRLASRVSRA